MAKRDDIINRVYSDLCVDRAIVTSVITQIHGVIRSEPAKHKDYGFVLAKYLECANKLNSQYLEILETMKKLGSDEISELSKGDKEDLLDEIQKEK